MKDTQKIWTDGMGLVQETNVGLPMAMRETALDSLTLNKGRETIMGTLILPMDSQTLVPQEDKDLVMDTLWTATHNQGLITERHPLGDTLTPPVGSQDPAQEHNKNPSITGQQTPPDAQPLDMDNRPLDTGPADSGDPV